MFKKVFLVASVAVLTACGGGSVDSVGTPTSTVTKPSQDKDAKTLTATGVRVIDGDTIEITLANASSERVRLLGIDAPESNQSYGFQSADNLTSCVIGKNVIIQWDKKDRYDRLIGKVLANGKDCNLKQVEDGYAWHYKQYQSEQRKEDRLTYSNAEVFARKAKKGLWADSCLIAPWNWRNGMTNCNVGTGINIGGTNNSGKNTGSNPFLEPPVTTNPVIPHTRPNTSVAKGCNTGKRCGNSCIAVTKVCHK